MEANFRLNNLEIRDDTIETVVPQNDIARLIYYLYCVSIVLEYDGFGRFTDYKFYFLIQSLSYIHLLNWHFYLNQNYC